MKSILEIVTDLNYKLSEEFTYNNPDYYLEYQTNGYSETISFNSFILWNSENDEREYLEEENEYEDLEKFLFKKIIEHVEKTLKFYNLIIEPKYNDIDSLPSHLTQTLKEE